MPLHAVWYNGDMDTRRHGRTSAYTERSNEARATVYKAISIEYKFKLPNDWRMGLEKGNLGLLRPNRCESAPQ